MKDPTPDQIREARERVGLSQREMSLRIFGPNSCRTIQNWELGKRPPHRGLYILFLLMTRQITTRDADKALKAHMQERLGEKDGE
jgi:DNA-binding transcriptional regulator YiaG